MQVHVNAAAVAVAEDVDVAAAAVAVAAAVEDIAPSSWDEEDNTQDGHDAFDDAEVEEEEVVVVHRHMVTCADNVVFHTLAQQQVEGMDIHDGHVAEEEEGDEDASFDDEDDRSAMVRDRDEDSDQASDDVVGEDDNDDEASVGVDVAAALVDHRDSLVEKLHQDALAVVVAVAADTTASHVEMAPAPFPEIFHQ